MSGVVLPFMGQLALPLLLWLLSMSLLLFLAMGLDKALAQRQRRRIPEKRLFLLAALGGAFGGWLGIYVFHHKTRHWQFVLGFPALALAQLALIVYLFIQGGTP